MPKPFRILSIDGGGIRGIVPALVLADLEARTGQRVSDLFDLVAGTSTGGVLALALTRDDPVPADKLVSLYGREGRSIFSKSFWRRLPGYALMDERYSDKGLVRVLKKYLGESSLAEASPPVLVTSYALERRMPFFFKSAKAKAPGTKASHDFPMWQVGRATSAAPTYFEPYKLEASGEGYYSLVDGGVFANNPAMCALAEAMGEGVAPSDIVMLSLGTGEHTRPIPHKDAVNWGLANWAVPIIGIMMDGVSDTVHYQVSKILGKGSYLRVQGKLTDAMDDMDDASRANIRALRRFAKGLVREYAEDLEALALRLNSPGAAEKAAGA